MKYLVKEFGADVNKKTLIGSTPLMVAIIKEHDDVVRWLLKNGANAQAKQKHSLTAADVSKLIGAPAKSTAYLEARTHCTSSGCCGAGLKKCANCLEVFFCSKDCQVAAWPAHKADCKRRVAAKAEMGM
jgi:ankyrin repeat protein